MTSRKAAIAELVRRVRLIKKVDGFATDVGLTAFVGETPVLGPDDAESAVAVMVQADELGYQGENVNAVIPVEVQAIARAGADAWATIEDVIGDVKRAVEADHDLARTVKPRGLERGVTKPLDRQDGSEFIGVSVEYRLHYAEGWGAP